MPERRTLVIGTTADYIDLLARRFPGRCLFLTDHAERTRAAEPAPPDEALCDLTDADGAADALHRHLAQHDVAPAGIACFDCESMPLAARIARDLALPYPSPDAVTACRSKALAKERWRHSGLPCPDSALVETLDDVAPFLEHGRVVLKPLTGSGSELLFICSTAAECDAALRTMRERLAQHDDARMYAPYRNGLDTVDPRCVFAAEQFVNGPEFSCDFTVDNGSVEVLRVAAKVPADEPGLTLAYIVPGDLPPSVDRDAFRSQLGAAARALGVDRGLCMLDFIVADGRAMMIELAPRPGGDCLPPLLRRSSGFDVLGAALDLAEGTRVSAPPPERWRSLVGLRLFADRAGVVRRIDADRLRADPRVVECHLKHGPGHEVILPPDDCDSRVLGYAVFEPADFRRTADECRELAAKLALDVEAPS